MNPSTGMADKLALDETGWLVIQPLPTLHIQHCHSPNQDERAPGSTIDLLVLHNISLPPGQFGGSAVVDLFLNRLDCDAHPFFDALRGVRVSAHFFIRRDGSLIQFASTLARAWHAGESSFEDRPRCNDFSIGIELEGTDVLPYTNAQYTTLVTLTRALRQRHPLRAVRGHEHIAPKRKTDPGASFDWPRYLQAADWRAVQAP